MGLIVWLVWALLRRRRRVRLPLAMCQTMQAAAAGQELSSLLGINITAAPASRLQMGMHSSRPRCDPSAELITSCDTSLHLLPAQQQSSHHVGLPSPAPPPSATLIMLCLAGNWSSVQHSHAAVRPLPWGCRLQPGPAHGRSCWKLPCGSLRSLRQCSCCPRAQQQSLW